MKRIRKFNESKTDIDYDYVYDCFAELIDDGKAEIELIQQSNPYISIRLNTQPKEDNRISSQSKPIGDQNSPIYNHIKNYNTNNYLLQELEVGLNRLSDKYPDYKLKFSEFSSSIFIEIFKIQNSFV